MSTFKEEIYADIDSLIAEYKDSKRKEINEKMREFIDSNKYGHIKECAEQLEWLEQLNITYSENRYTNEEESINIVEKPVGKIKLPCKMGKKIIKDIYPYKMFIGEEVIQFDLDTSWNDALLELLERLKGKNRRIFEHISDLLGNKNDYVRSHIAAFKEELRNEDCFIDKNLCIKLTGDIKSKLKIMESIAKLFKYETIEFIVYGDNLDNYSFIDVYTYEEEDYELDYNLSSYDETDSNYIEDEDDYMDQFIDEFITKKELEKANTKNQYFDNKIVYKGEFIRSEYLQNKTIVGIVVANTKLAIDNDETTRSLISQLMPKLYKLDKKKYHTIPDISSRFSKVRSELESEPCDSYKQLYWKYSGSISNILDELYSILEYYGINEFIIEIKNNAWSVS